MQHMSDAQHIERRLIELNVEHRDLDAVIELLILDGHHDELQLRRLKAQTAAEGSHHLAENAISCPTFQPEGRQ
jgi:hypothetical protein